MGSARPIVTLVLLLLGLSLGACGDDTPDGGGMLPYGCQPGDVCFGECVYNRDCPADRSCILNKRGTGSCLRSCEFTSDCRGGETCQLMENRGTGFDSTVCVIDTSS